MNNINPSIDQWMGILRQLLPALGGIAVALGWIPADKMNALVASILAVAGPLMILVGLVWSLIANSQFSIRKAAAKLPENQETK